MDSVRIRRLTSLLAEFDLPAGADANELQARFRVLAKERHPDMVATHRRAQATKDFAKLHSCYKEALALLEQAAQSPAAGMDHVIRTHNGLFYHDPYKWRPPPRPGYKWQAEAHQVPQASLATKMKGVAMVGGLLALFFFVFDRTARKRNFWDS